MAVSPPAGRGLVTFDVLVNGTSVDAATEIILIDIRSGSPGPDQARVATRVGAEVFEVAVSDSFPLGAGISIALGYDGQTTVMFKGFIASLGVSADQAQGAELVVMAEASGRDELAKSGSVMTLTYGENILAMDLTRTGQSDGPAGEVRIAGTAAAAPGRSVTLQGIGPTFDGRCRISGVRHNVSEGQWTTTLSLGKAAAAGSD